MQSGRVAEWSIAPVLKTGNAERRSRVRIPPLPLLEASPGSPIHSLAAPAETNSAPDKVQTPAKSAVAETGGCRVFFATLTESSVERELRDRLASRLTNLGLRQFLSAAVDLGDKGLLGCREGCEEWSRAGDERRHDFSGGGEVLGDPVVQHDESRAGGRNRIAFRIAFKIRKSRLS